MDVGLDQSVIAAGLELRGAVSVGRKPPDKERVAAYPMGVDMRQGYDTGVPFSKLGKMAEG